MNVPAWVWIAVITAIAIIFTISLIFGRKAHVISVPEAARWVAVYVSLAVLFGMGIWYFAGGEYATLFFTGYLTEYALSIDNLFVFVILLTAFRVPRELQGRVVLIGIMIALVLRGGLIAVGAIVIERFSWVFYLFGLFLVLTAWKLAKEKHDPDEVPEEPKTVAMLRRFIPMSNDFHGTKLTTRENGKRLFTPMFVVILALGITDLLFALDSIPAIFGITTEPFLVFTANAFALLGLSELYFLLGALLGRLIFLSKGLALILAFIGAKLIMEALAGNTLPFINGGQHVTWAPHIEPFVSMAVVMSILLATVALSLIVSRRHESKAQAAAASGVPAVSMPAPPLDGVGTETYGPMSEADRDPAAQDSGRPD